MVVVGIIIIAMTCFNFSDKDKEAKIGPVEVDKNDYPIKWTPTIGALSLIIGVVLIGYSKTKK